MAAQAADAHLDGWVPGLDHATFDDWNLVYEPSEDTFLLLDALFADRAALRAGRALVEEHLNDGRRGDRDGRAVAQRKQMHSALDA